MKNIRTIALILVLCLSAALLPVSAAAVSGTDPQPNLTRYIPYPHDPADVDQAHTIHWAQGVTPPTMPGQLLPDGTVVGLKQADFVMVNSFGGVTKPKPEDKNYIAYYVTDYQPDSGWYDTNKYAYYDEGQEPRPTNGVEDESACYAAASSNVISWWLDQNRDHIQDYLRLVEAGTVTQLPELADPALLQGYLDAQTNGIPDTDPRHNLPYNMLLEAYHSIHHYDGGFVNLAMDIFFNGYKPYVSNGLTINNPNRFQPYQGGGFFHPVFGKSLLTLGNANVNYETLSNSFKGYMDAGYGVTLGYWANNVGTHAISVWGAEYDENDKLCGLYITDSNDGDNRSNQYWDHNKTERHISMFRYNVLTKRNGYAAITTSSYVNPDSNAGSLYNVYLLDPAQEEWTYFLEHHAPMYPDNRPLITYDDYLNPLPAAPVLGEPSWSLSFADAPTLSDTFLSVTLTAENTGKEDTVTLLAASYDADGRQLHTTLLPVTVENGQVQKTLSLNTFGGRLHHVSAFLLNDDSAPVAKSVTQFV